LAEVSDGAQARTLLTQAAEAGHVPSMLRLADESETLEPIEALAWLYEAAALSANEDYVRRAKSLAREMVVSDIDAALARARKHLAWLENLKKLGRAPGAGL
jgi:TPR repeat protein